jgi:homoserine dehydrogenase
VAYLFEASVGGGIPIIRPMCHDLASNNITEINGILNGTTNYILTKMTDEGTAFADVLKEAQDKGYAERNPAADIEGLDAARKIVILASLAFGKAISPNDIHVEGITNITTEDVEIANNFGYSIKLIGHAEMIDGKIHAMVSPRLIPHSNPLSGINDVFNGILLNADMVGQVMFYGPGAGKLPTASAVCGDIVDIIAHMDSGMTLPEFSTATDEDIAIFENYACKRFFIFEKCPECKITSECVEKCFGVKSSFACMDNKVAVITEAMSERSAADIARNLKNCKTYRLL